MTERTPIGPGDTIEAYYAPHWQDRPYEATVMLLKYLPFHRFNAIVFRHWTDRLCNDHPAACVIINGHRFAGSNRPDEIEHGRHLYLPIKEPPHAD